MAVEKSGVSSQNERNPRLAAKVAGTLRRAVRWSELTRILGERHMECAYYFDFRRLCLASLSTRQAVLFDRLAEAVLACTPKTIETIVLHSFTCPLDSTEDAMQIENENEKRRRFFSRQFSLSMLMLIVTGIGCYLGGRIQGYRQGLAVWDDAPIVTNTYSLGDLVPSSRDSAESEAMLESLTLKIKSEVLPGVWKESGGKAAARAFAKNSSVVVSANNLVHEAIRNYSIKAREQAVASNQ